MMNIYLDIETIPCQQSGVLEEIRATIKPPGNITKAESIEKWMQENADKAAQEEYLKTSFNGTLGEIVCIGWAVEDGPVQSVCRRLWESEAGMLKMFYDHLQEHVTRPPAFVGHNVLAFDLRFLFHRSVILGVKPPVPLRQDTRYNGEYVYDTMLAWAGWGNRISLVNLCKALHIPVKTNGCTGAEVWQYMQDGRVLEVVDYCREDIAAVRQCYKKMTFSL